MKNKKIIPLGIGFWFSLFIFALFIVGSIFGMVAVFINIINDFYHDWFTFIIMFLFFILSVSLLMKLVKKNGVRFENDKVIIESISDIKKYQSTTQSCKNFMSFELKYRNLLLCLEFTMINGEIIYFAVTQYTKRQLLKILQEIKNRGGFPNQEIVIAKTSFKKMIE